LKQDRSTLAGAKIKRVLGGRSRPAVVDEAAEWLATLLAQGASPRTCAVYRNALDALGAHLAAAAHLLLNTNEFLYLD
jgi:ferric-dicitrate binding protein FerR (iron transport regulator)